MGSKDVLPEDFLAVFKELKKEHPLNGFTLAINDDVTNLSLPREPKMPVDTNWPYGPANSGLRF